MKDNERKRNGCSLLFVGMWIVICFAFLIAGMLVGAGGPEPIMSLAQAAWMRLNELWQWFTFTWPGYRP